MRPSQLGYGQASRRRRLDDGNGEFDGGVVRDQLKLVVDVGLAILAITGRDFGISGFVVTSSVAVGFCTRGHLDQF